MNRIGNIGIDQSEYRNRVLLSPRPGSIKDYSRLATMIACLYKSMKARHRECAEEGILRRVYLQRLKEIVRLYPHPALRPHGFENIENPAYIEKALADIHDLPGLIRKIIIDQFPDIPLHHTFGEGTSLDEELDTIIQTVIDTYVPAYGGSNPACTAENYNAVA